MFWIILAVLAIVATVLASIFGWKFTWLKVREMEDDYDVGKEQKLFKTKKDYERDSLKAAREYEIEKAKLGIKEKEIRSKRSFTDSLFTTPEDNEMPQFTY